MNEIEKVSKQELAWNERTVKSTEEEIVRIITPMFAGFPNTKADKHTFAFYVKGLQDIAPDRLAWAVDRASFACKFLPTVADIREQLETHSPGPRNDVDPTKLKPVPDKMFRLDPEEDKRQRMEQLRRTKDWRY